MVCTLPPQAQAEMELPKALLANKPVLLDVTYGAEVGGTTIPEGRSPPLLADGLVVSLSSPLGYHEGPGSGGRLCRAHRAGDARSAGGWGGGPNATLRGVVADVSLLTWRC